jgi:hypothetical protein
MNQKRVCCGIEIDGTSWLDGSFISNNDVD